MKAFTSGESMREGLAEPFTVRKIILRTMREGIVINWAPIRDSFACEDLY